MATRPSRRVNLPTPAMRLPPSREHRSRRSPPCHRTRPSRVPGHRRSPLGATGACAARGRRRDAVLRRRQPRPSSAPTRPRYHQHRLMRCRLGRRWVPGNDLGRRRGGGDPCGCRRTDGRDRWMATGPAWPGTPMAPLRSNRPPALRHPRRPPWPTRPGWSARNEVDGSPCSPRTVARAPCPGRPPRPTRLYVDRASVAGVAGHGCAA